MATKYTNTILIFKQLLNYFGISIFKNKQVSTRGLKMIIDDTGVQVL